MPIAYQLGKDSSCLFEELIIALLDKVVVLPQIDGFVRRSIARVCPLSIPIEMNLPSCQTVSIGDDEGVELVTYC